jgi:hypothetical protein
MAADCYSYCEETDLEALFNEREDIKGNHLLAASARADAQLFKAAGAEHLETQRLQR